MRKHEGLKGQEPWSSQKGSGSACLYANELLHVNNIGFIHEGISQPRTSQQEGKGWLEVPSGWYVVSPNTIFFRKAREELRVIAFRLLRSDLFPGWRDRKTIGVAIGMVDL